MRIIHTPPRYAPHIGGVEAVDKVLAEYAAEQGHQVWVLAADEPRRGPSEVNGIRVQRLSWHLKLANTNLTPGLPRALWSAQWDVVHTHLPTPWTADVSVLVAKVLRRRSVVHFHNPIVGDGLAGLVAWVYRKTLQRMTMRLTDAIIVISATRQELLISGQPSIAAKVHLVPNGVDLERFAPVPFAARSTADVLFVSVLDDFHDYKGLSVLLQAAAYVPGATLRIVGDGPGRGRWEREAVALGIADRVHFEGAVSNADLLGLYRSCAVFALPSQTADHEGGSSLVALEAMASGLPVVLADGVGDLAAQAQAAGGGIAVRSGDAKGLAVALSTLLGSATTRESAGVAARAHVERHHSWDAACEKITAHYLRTDL